MVVCDSSEQAKCCLKYLNQIRSKENSQQSSYGCRTVRRRESAVTTAAILHDIGTKQDRKDQVETKDGKIDFCLY
jgi:type I restriction enzyme R subunit